MDIDKKLVQESELTFVNNNKSKTLLLNDDGIVELYEEGKLVESKPFSKITVERDYKKLTQEGYNLLESVRYNIYLLLGEDGVYNSKLVDTVDSLEQAQDRIAELQAENGCSAYYEEVLEEDTKLQNKEIKTKLKETICGNDETLMDNEWAKLYIYKDYNKNNSIQPNDFNLTILSDSEGDHLEGTTKDVYRYLQALGIPKEDKDIEVYTYPMQETSYTVYDSNGESLKDFVDKDEAIKFAKKYPHSSIVGRTYIKGTLQDDTIETINMDDLTDLKLEANTEQLGKDLKQTEQELKDNIEQVDRAQELKDELTNKLNKLYNDEDKLQEDQYENERRRGIPPTKRIAEQEVYDNKEWYKEHIKDYLDITDFVNKNIAEIASEYNLRDTTSEEVCKEVYKLALKLNGLLKESEDKQSADNTTLMPSSTLTSKKLTKQEILDMNQIPVSEAQAEFLRNRDIDEDTIIEAFQDLVKQMKHLQNDKPFMSIEEYVNEILKF